MGEEKPTFGPGPAIKQTLQPLLCPHCERAINRPTRLIDLLWAMSPGRAEMKLGWCTSKEISARLDITKGNAEILLAQARRHVLVEEMFPGECRGIHRPTRYGRLIFVKWKKAGWQPRWRDWWKNQVPMRTVLDKRPCPVVPTHRALEKAELDGRRQKAAESSPASEPTA